MKSRIRKRFVVFSLMFGFLLQFNLPVAQAGTYDSRYSGITPNTSSFTTWATGGIGVPGYFVFDAEGNAWGIKSTGSGQCIVKIIPNANGTSGNVSAIYGAAGTCSSLVVAEGTAVYETLGRTGAGATSVAWIDLTHLGIGTTNGIYSWDISATPSVASLTKIETSNASKLAFDGSQNVLAVQSVSGLASGSQTRIKRFSLTDPTDSSTVYSTGDAGISCPTISNVAVSLSGLLYISCPRGGSQFTTVQVNLNSGAKSLFSDFAGGPMTIDASGSIYIVGVLDAFTSAHWPTVTKLSATGLVQSYWTYDVTGDRTEIAIDLAGNIYSLNGGGDTISKLFGTSIPFAPIRVSGSAGPNSAIVSWFKPGVTGLETYTATALPGGQSCVTVWPSASCTISGLTNGNTYSVSVQASNRNGTSASSAAVNVIPLSVPDSPTAVTASIATSTSALVAFTAPANNGGSAITSFTVTSFPHGRTGTGTSSPVQVTGLTSGSPETFTVTATNAIGISDSSTASNVVIPTDVYNVTFDSQGGSSVSSGTFVSGGTVAAPGASPAKSGYSFKGWYATSTGGTVLTFPYSPGVTSNIVLYAQWTLIPVLSANPSHVVLDPPPSTFIVVTNPKISRSSTELFCLSGTYKFKQQGGMEEASHINSQLISLLSDGSVVDSEKTLNSHSTFDLKASYKGTTLSCEVGIQEDEVIKTYSSLDKEGISTFEAAMNSAIHEANTLYYSERKMAYLKRDSGDAKSWREMLDKALAKREASKVEASLDYVKNLERAGISILITADQSATTPAPRKSPDVSVAGNVQPTTMKLIGNIYFASGTYFLNDEAKKTIKSLATSIIMNSPKTVLSYGFTDSKGGIDNTVLSHNRAKAVAQLLHSFLPGQKIATGWYASSKPIATGNSMAALAKNRRVEIYVK